MGCHTMPWRGCPSWDCIIHTKHLPMFFVILLHKGASYQILLLHFSEWFCILFEICLFIVFTVSHIVTFFFTIIEGDVSKLQRCSGFKPLAYEDPNMVTKCLGSKHNYTQSSKLYCIDQVLFGFFGLLCPMYPWATPCSRIPRRDQSGTAWSSAPIYTAPVCYERRNGGSTSRRCLRGERPPSFASWQLSWCWATTFSLREIHCALESSSLTALLSNLSRWPAAGRDWGERHTECLSLWGRNGRSRGCSPCAHIACCLAAWIRSRGFPWVTYATVRTHCSLPLTPYVGTGRETRQWDFQGSGHSKT